MQVAQLILLCSYVMAGAEEALCKLLDKLPQCMECMIYETGLDQHKLENLRPAIKFHSKLWLVYE